MDHARSLLACTALAVPLAGCAAAVGTPPRPAAATASSSSSIDHLTAVAKQRYASEVHGGTTRATLRRVARDPALRAALASGDVTRLRVDVRREFWSVWYHWHVSRLRILRAGTHMLVDVGVPFVVAPAQMTLRDARGRPLGTLQVSIQDVIGFVRYMHRNHPVDVVVRGRGAAHARASWPAALHARLPDSGTATVGGRRYRVGSFTATALGGEPVKAWILQRR
jgi:hypothetical protein